MGFAIVPPTGKRANRTSTADTASIRCCVVQSGHFPSSTLHFPGATLHFPGASLRFTRASLHFVLWRGVLWMLGATVRVFAL